MKKNSLVGIIIGIFTVVVILVLIASFALNAATPRPVPSTAAASSVADTPDPCAQKNLQVTVPDLDKLMRQFDDSIQIAQNTPGNQLVPIITDLQAARRSTEDFAAPSCMENLKQLQLSYMNAYINTLLALYNNYGDMATAKPYVAMATALSATATPPVAIRQYLALFEQDAALINQGISQANGYHNQYEAEKARLLGVTLTPSSEQIVPVITATAVGATPTP